MSNAKFITFSQHVLRDKLLLMSKKNDANGEIILELIITYHLRFVIKMLWV